MSRYESDNSLRLYLREIAKTDLLTPAQEVELAARIKKGDKEARSHMIRANLRLVVKIAQDYSNYGSATRRPHLRGQHRPHESRGTL